MMNKNIYMRRDLELQALDKPQESLKAKGW